jgi:hypothetical protein
LLIAPRRIAWIAVRRTDTSAGRAHLLDGIVVHAMHRTPAASIVRRLYCVHRVANLFCRSIRRRRCADAGQFESNPDRDVT